MHNFTNLTKSDLIRIIQKMISISDDNQLFVDSYISSFSGNKKVNIDLYKKKISKALDYDQLGGFDWDFEKVDRILNSLANATENSATVAEVSVFAVVEGEKITNEMGDIDEAYYESMENLFEKAVQCVLIQTSTIISENTSFSGLFLLKYRINCSNASANHLFYLYFVIENVQYTANCILYNQ